MPSGHGGSVIKLKSFWYRVYAAGSKPSNYRKRIVIVYRRITWLNPEPAFREAMMLRFKHRKQVSYNPATDRLYLYSHFRRWETVTRLDESKPFRGFYAHLNPCDREPSFELNEDGDDYENQEED